jgi:hypothetical protein
LRCQIVLGVRAWLSAKKGIGIQREDSSDSMALPGSGRDNK